MLLIEQIAPNLGGPDVFIKSTAVWPGWRWSDMWHRFGTMLVPCLTYGSDQLVN